MHRLLATCWAFFTAMLVIGYQPYLIPKHVGRSLLTTTPGTTGRSIMPQYELDSGFCRPIYRITAGVYPNTKLSMSSNNPYQQDGKHEFSSEKLGIWDMGSILVLAGQQFLPQCKTLIDKVDLLVYIVYLFAPKLLFERTWGHAVIGLKATSPSRELMGFVDLSLQVNNGSLDALKVTPLCSRQQRYGVDHLQPYLCNLLVGAQFRRRGLGRALVRECQKLALGWGYGEVLLHCMDTDLPALSLYISEGFQVQQGGVHGGSGGGGGVLFLRKSLLPFSSGSELLSKPAALAAAVAQSTLLSTATITGIEGHQDLS